MNLGRNEYNFMFLMFDYSSKGEEIAAGPVVFGSFMRSNRLSRAPYKSHPLTWDYVQ